MDGHVFALHQYGRNVTFLTFYHKIIIFFSYFHMLFNKFIERSVQKAHWNVMPSGYWMRLRNVEKSI